MLDKTRNNHYVPQWYQRGFLFKGLDKLHVLDLAPPTKRLNDGRVIKFNAYREIAPVSNLYKRDLYSIFFEEYIDDNIEKKLFGQIDDIGSIAVKSFIENDVVERQKNLIPLLEYMNAQKIRTIKGLDWIKSNYPSLKQIDLMNEMIELRSINCTLWGECVREVVSAKKSKIKFIISDHPITTYNYKCPPENKYCRYPNDPSIAFCATQTIFPLDQDNCLLLTNYEYAENPNKVNPIKNRINSKNNRQTLIKTNNIIKNRFLNELQVNSINYVIKKGAKQYICASKKEWLCPEDIDKNIKWENIKDILLPSRHEIGIFGGKIYAGYDDGRNYFQDEYGRTTPGIEYLDKKIKEKIGTNDYCPCGSGKKFKRCCKYKKEEERSSWNTLSIRERNMTLINGVIDILGFEKGKTWEDVKKEISEDHIKRIYQLIKSLWPIDSDIIDLFPKPDKTLRALYSGITHPKMISQITNLTMYFDEVLVENPFLNPNNLNKEYNPLDNPSKFKLNTLKNLQFLIQLIPFIEIGLVNLIPDITNFYPKLKKQISNMAKVRNSKNNLKLDSSEMEWLHDEMLEQNLFLLDEESFIHKINKNQKISKSLNKDLRKYYHTKRLEDPLILLQNGLFENAGQLTINNLSPNYEAFLLISQITGSIAITNSPNRWNEITYNQTNDLYINIQKKLYSKKNPFLTDPMTILENRNEKNFYNYRKILKGIKLLIEDKNYNEVKINLLNEEISQINGKIKNDSIYNLRFTMIAPNNGIIDKNVQRIILSLGVNNFYPNLPIAMFFEIETS